MATLGNLSLNISANTGKLKIGLNNAIKLVNEFSNNLSKITSTMNKPFKLKIEIPKTMTDNINNAATSAGTLAGNLERALLAATNLKNIGIDVAKGAAPKGGPPMAPQEPKAPPAPKAPKMTPVKTFIGETPQEVEGKFAKWGEEMNKIGIASNRLLNSGIKPLEDGTYKMTATIKDSAAKSQRAFSDMSKNGIASMLSLQNMLKKIVHYITFSIGVQMVMGVRQAITNLIESFKEFERSATNAATVAGYLGGAFTKVRDHIMQVSKELGRNTIFSAMDVSKAFYNLASAGYDVADMTGKDLEPILNYAAATQASLEDATYAVATSLKAFKLEIQDSTEVVDIFTSAITSSFMTFDKLREAMKYVGPIAGELGLGLSETVASLSTLVDRGMEGSQAGQRLNMIFTKLLKPTDKARDILQSMGLTVNDLNPEVYTLTEILYKLQAAGFGAAEAAGMFRARTAASATVLVSSAAEIDRYNQSLLASYGITESVAEQQEQTLWGAFQLMGNALQEIGLEIGQKLAPLLTSFANIMKNKIGPALGDMVNTIIKFLPVITNLVKVFILYKLAVFGVTKAMAAYKAILMLVTTLQGGYTVLTGALTNAFYSLFKGIVAATTSLSGFAALLAATGVGILVIGLGLLVNSLLSVGDSVNNIRYSFKDIEDLDIMGVTSQVSSIELALYDAINTAKNFGDALYRISDKDLESGATLGLYSVEEIKEEGKKLFDILAEQEPKIRAKLEDMYSFSVPSPGFLGMPLKLPPVGDALRAFSDAYEDEINKIVLETLGLTEEEILAKVNLAKAYTLLSTEIVLYNSSLRELAKTTEEYNEASKNLEDLQNKIANGYQASVIEMTQANKRLKEAELARSEAQIGALRSIKSLLTETRRYSVALDEGIGYIEEYAAKSASLESQSLRLVSAIRNEEKASKDLIDALAEGRSLEEITDAEIDLTRASSDRASLESSIADLEEEKNRALDRRNTLMREGISGEYTFNELRKKGFTISQIENELLDGKNISYEELRDNENKTVEISQALTQTEKDLLDLSFDLVDARGAYNESLSEEVLLKAKVSALDLIREKHLTISNEKLKNFLEQQSKIFDIEYKLYKLREGEKSQFDDLFNKLAEEGLVNQEVIDLFKEMKTAEGEVLGMNHDLMGVYGDLTDNQRELAEQFINGEISQEDFIKGMKDNNELTKDGNKITQEQIDAIIAYDNAQNRLNDSVKAFGDIIGPVMQDLIDAGIVSPEIAKAWGDIADNASELTELNIELAIATSKLDDSMTGIIGNTTRLAQALVDDEEAGETFYTVLDDLIKRMGITDAVGGDLLNTLNSFYKTSKGSVEDFTEAQVIAALSMIQVADAAKAWEPGMAGEDLAPELNLGSLQSYINESELAFNNQESFIELSKQLANATETVATSFDNLTEVLSDYLDLLGGVGGEENIVEFSTRFDASDLFEGFETALDFFKEIGDTGSDFTADLFKDWDDSDYQAWLDLLKTEFGDEVIDELNEVTPELDFSKLWGGKTEEQFKNEVEKNATFINEVFKRVKTKAYIQTVWDDYDWYSYYSNFKSNVESIRSAAEEAGIKLNLEAGATWTNASSFSEFMQNLTTNEIGILQAHLAQQDMGFPIYYKDMFSEETIQAMRDLQNEVYKDPIYVEAKVKPDFTGMHLLGSTLPGIGYDIGAETGDKLSYSIMDKFNVLGTNLPTIGAGIGRDIGSDMVDGIKEKWDENSNSLVDKLTEPFTLIKNPIMSIINGIINSIGNIRIGITPFITHSKGGLVGLKKGTEKTSGPTQALIGEAGAEAVVPLEGANKKYGQDILQRIIPKYFPEMMQDGGIVSDVVQNINRNILGYEEIPEETKDMEELPQYQYGAIIESVANSDLETLDDKKQLIKQQMVTTPIPLIDNVNRRIKDIFYGENTPIPEDLDNIINQKIIEGEINTPEDLTSHINMELDNLKVPDLEEKKINISQKLEELSIPNIEREIDYIIKKIPEYEYSDIIQSVSEAELTEPEEQIQYVKQQMIDTPIKLIKDINRKISSMFLDYNIPIPEDIDRVINQSIVNENIKSPEDLTQTILSFIDPVDIPDYEDKQINISQRLDKINIPDMQKEIEYIVDKIPQYQKGVTETRGPVNAIIGEAGAEAVVPLEGSNKKYGESILQKIIPKYFPNTKFMQTGGIVGGADIGDSETYNINEIILNLSSMEELLQSILNVINSSIVSNLVSIKASLDSSLFGVSGTNEIDTSELSSSADELGTTSEQLDMTVQAITKVFDDIVEKVNSLVPVFEGVTDKLNNTVNTIINTLESRFNQIVNQIIPTLSDMLDTIKSDFAYWFSTDFRAIGEVVGNAFAERTSSALKLASGVIVGAAKEFSMLVTNAGRTVRSKIYGQGYTYQRGMITDKPTMGVFGEAGAEALVPLEGKNKKFGRQILETIIPNYYPELLGIEAQAGGIFNTSYTGGSTISEIYEDNYNITGPINVTGVQNVNDFMNTLKNKARASKRY